MREQLEHDPFSPHVEVGFPPEWKSPELQLADDELGGTQSVEMRRGDGTTVTTLEVEELATAAPDDDSLVLEADETVAVEHVPDDATEDADPTPPPGPGKRSRKKSTRSKARTEALAKELEGE